MREIKFRAWDIENKKWLSFDDGDPIADDGSLSDSGYWCFEFDFDDKKIALMQYTGLKDKNGKEIYEGDIVEYRDFHTSQMSGDGDEFINIGVVEWDNDNAMFCVSNRHEIDMEDFDWSECEVIGNIYENPELLK